MLNEGEEKGKMQNEREIQAKRKLIARNWEIFGSRKRI